MSKVLIVEDSPVMGELLCSMVEEIDGVDITLVVDGLAALKQLSLSRFDLIVTDINMPNVNGLELLSFVKRNSNHVNTPVIIVTTETAAKDRQKGMSLGADAYISKPFHRQQFLDIAQRLIK